MAALRNLEESFLKISFEEVSSTDAQQSSKDHGHKNEVYPSWEEEHSHKATDPGAYLTNALRKKYSGWSVVRVSSPFAFPLLSFPDLITRPIPGETLDSLVTAFLPFARNTGRSSGVLLEVVKFGGFLGAWKDWDYLIYYAIFPSGMFQEQNMWILHQGSEEPAHLLLNVVGTWYQELHDEVLIYDQGYWRKDPVLYREIQKADWKDVILKKEFKSAIQGDIKNFFKSQAVYKELGVPWKRGLIFHGPAGNGKTISLKAAMRDTSNPILYVRSFTNWAGDEAAMADIFGMARRFSPCMLVIEDIDSHINERNRSFFLNELDGLDNNDGILLIATTNHLERLDNSVSNRPSRFDRKYLFDDPDEEERRLYCGYWQRKLENNKKISFPDELADEIARTSGGLSFAYLKEAFVSTLILMAGDDSIDFGETLKSQIKELLDQIKKPPQVESSFNRKEEAASANNALATRTLTELLQRLTKMETPRGLSTQSIIPTSNMPLRKWI